MPAIVCEICRKIFSRKDNLKRHVETVHINPTTNNQQNVEIHDEVNARTPMPCTLCDKIVLNHNMVPHKRLFHVPLVGPFCEDIGRVPEAHMAHKIKKCDVCDLHFLFDYSFVCHMSTHGLTQSEIKAALKVYN